MFAYVYMYRFNAEKFEYPVLSARKFLNVLEKNGTIFGLNPVKMRLAVFSL